MDIITISLGKNPVNGGRPLIDRIISGIIRNIIFMEEEAFCSCSWVSDDIQYIIMNIGVDRIQ